MSLTSYIADTRAEMRHVHWPSRAQAIRFTLAVIGLSVAVAVLLGVFDVIFNSLLRLIF